MVSKSAGRALGFVRRREMKLDNVQVVVVSGETEPRCRSCGLWGGDYVALTLPHV